MFCPELARTRVWVPRFNVDGEVQFSWNYISKLILARLPWLGNWVPSWLPFYLTYIAITRHLNVYRNLQSQIETDTFVYDVLSIYLSIHPSIYLSIYIYICMFNMNFQVFNWSIQILGLQYMHVRYFGCMMAVFFSHRQPDPCWSSGNDNDRYSLFVMRPCVYR